MKEDYLKSELSAKDTAGLCSAAEAALQFLHNTNHNKTSQLYKNTMHKVNWYNDMAQIKEIYQV